MIQLVTILLGMALGILATVGVAPSLFQSGDAATSSMVAQEVSTVRQSSLMWLANKSSDGTFNGLSAEALTTFIPDLAVTGTGASSEMASKAKAGVTFAVAATDANRKFEVTIEGLNADMEAAVKDKLAKTPGVITDADPEDGILVIKYNG